MFFRSKLDTQLLLFVVINPSDAGIQVYTPRVYHVKLRVIYMFGVEMTIFYSDTCPWLASTLEPLILKQLALVRIAGINA